MRNTIGLKAILKKTGEVFAALLVVPLIAGMLWLNTRFGVKEETNCCNDAKCKENSNESCSCKNSAENECKCHQKSSEEIEQEI